jgi:hypothetical protein
MMSNHTCDELTPFLQKNVELARKLQHILYHIIKPTINYTYDLYEEFFVRGFSNQVEPHHIESINQTYNKILELYHDDVFYNSFSAVLDNSPDHTKSFTDIYANTVLDSYTLLANNIIYLMFRVKGPFSLNQVLFVRVWSTQLSRLLFRKSAILNFPC